ncbi:hypothetical protein C7T94_17405 [Pedobacter yulinensis]|uniref:DUF4468 domain-containing protein n=1 Tax=Pedobacter yulinensis TaxID=2126353 RepID=A0A2T3HHT6_9SPHI|nr:hypothetical protein [Pedobacter yulinensis]PST81963.1 hypothetical protein C7T94_17405 [Pedobacter yulinensis]
MFLRLQLCGKPVFLLCYLVCICSTLAGQTSSAGRFSKDENDKFTWYEVVHEPLPSDTLFSRMQGFLAAEGIKVLQSGQEMGGEGLFRISRSALVSAHPAARISFSFHMEWKEGKYRYWLTNFTSTPFKRNRYGQFELQQGISTPLEEEPGSLNRKNWEADLKSVEGAARRFSVRMRLAMARSAPAQASQPRVVKGSDW